MVLPLETLCCSPFLSTVSMLLTAWSQCGHKFGAIKTNAPRTVFPCEARSSGWDLLGGANPHL
jgi:hypothetical protein